MGEQFVVDLRSELGQIDLAAELARQRKHCIFKVPRMLRDLNPEAYTPQLVSFGPYHHGLLRLRSMEHHKRLALSSYLRRACKTIAEVADAMKPEVCDLMDCYDDLNEQWRADEEAFLNLMILDGCFFLELMIYNGGGERVPTALHDPRALDGYAPAREPAAHRSPRHLDDSRRPQEDNNKFKKIYNKRAPVTTNARIREMGLHHLDICRKNETVRGSYSYDPKSSVRPATELYQAGVVFKKSDSRSLKDISFGNNIGVLNFLKKNNGVLKLPPFKFDNNTEPLLLNFLVYEQTGRDMDSAVTSYARLMDNLVNSPKDVELLRESGVIAGWEGSDKSIASLFNRLTKAMTFAKAKSNTENVNKELKSYCNKTWNKWGAIFKQTYLSNPWVFASLVAAIYLLLITTAQTVYTILPYYKG